MIDSGHVARKAAKEGIALPENKADYIVEEKVETISPQKLMQDHNIQKISLLVVDTEGYDYEILKKFDIPSPQPRAVIYEAQHLSKEVHMEALTLLSEAGYFCKSIDGNTLAIRRDDKDADLF